MDKFSRTKRIFGENFLEVLKEKNVLVFGLGGVGGYVVEALVRGGIHNITIVDGDSVDISNINRQIIATNDTIGMRKVLAMKNRISSINECVKVEMVDMYFKPDSVFDFTKFDYVIDAIDMVGSKVEIIKRAKLLDIPVISAMGMGNKIKPEQLEVADIEKTEVCPLAKAVRKELRKLEIKKVKVVYSKEIPIVKSSPPGSTSFVPGTCGLIIAGEVLKDLLEEK